MMENYFINQGLILEISLFFFFFLLTYFGVLIGFTRCHVFFAYVFKRKSAQFCQQIQFSFHIEDQTIIDVFFHFHGTWLVAFHHLQQIPL